MKKTLPIILLTIVTLFFACSKDDDPSPKEEDKIVDVSDIVGKWTITQLKVNSEFTAEIDECIKNYTFTFAAPDNYQIFDICKDTGIIGKFSKKDNVITCVYGNTSTTFQVISIDGDVGTFIKTDGDNTKTEIKATREAI